MRLLDLLLEVFCFSNADHRALHPNDHGWKYHPIEENDVVNKKKDCRRSKMIRRFICLPNLADRTMFLRSLTDDNFFFLCRQSYNMSLSLHRMSSAVRERLSQFHHPENRTLRFKHFVPRHQDDWRDQLRHQTPGTWHFTQYLTVTMSLLAARGDQYLNDSACEDHGLRQA